MLNNLIPLQEAGGSAGMMDLIMIVALIAIFYFFMIISFNAHDNSSVTQNLIRPPVQFFFRIDG